MPNMLLINVEGKGFEIVVVCQVLVDAFPDDLLTLLAILLPPLFVVILVGDKRLEDGLMSVRLFIHVYHLFTHLNTLTRLESGTG